MPEMDGIETLKEIKKLKPETEVIMLTGHASVKVGIDGMNVCLQKVLDKWGIKIGEGFRFPNTFYRSIKQPLKCNYTSFAEALCFS